MEPVGRAGRRIGHVTGRLLAGTVEAYLEMRLELGISNDDNDVRFSFV